ncbi:MAG: MFS transporter [Burkholderiales bacterium]|nr:MFS transporter [Burkholderiales bacterium]
MMGFLLIVLVTVLTHTSFKGSKVLISLYAIDLGATPLTIGVLFSMYSLFPIFLSVYAGRLSDRLGCRAPMLFGACGLLAGLLLPFLLPRIEALFVSAAMIGMCYIFYTIAVQHLIGSFGAGAERTRNYSTFSLGIALTALLGPVTAGFAIDLVGHRNTYALIAKLQALHIVVLLVFGARLPRTRSTEEPAGPARHGSAAQPAAAACAVTAGIIETGLELYNPAADLRAPHRHVGIADRHHSRRVPGCAPLLVRLVMPALARRFQRGARAEHLAVSGLCDLRAVSARDQLRAADGDFVRARTRARLWQPVVDILVTTRPPDARERRWGCGRFPEQGNRIAGAAHLRLCQHRLRHDAGVPAGSVHAGDRRGADGQGRAEAQTSAAERSLLTPRQSTFAPDAFTTSAHFVTSSRSSLLEFVGRVA